MKIVFKCLIFLLVLGCSSDDKSEDPNNQANNQSNTTNNTNNQNEECVEDLECPDFYVTSPGCEGEGCLTVMQCDTNETLDCIEGDQACNNEFADCDEGYEEDFECSGDNADPTCVEVGGTCGAPSGYFCSCSKCYGSEVDSCDGLTDCQTYDSCGETKFCATCEDPVCGDRERIEAVVEWCEESVLDCRLETCPSAAAITYGCIAVAECPETPDCPAGTVSCDVESATCVMTKTCGTTLLCEAS